MVKSGGSVFGEDVTTIVLLPGLDGIGVLLDEFRAALGTKSVVISYPSDRPLNYVELEQLVLSALPADEPFILVGESFSGPIAIALAAKAPPRLRALVLVCSFAKSPLPRLPLVLQKALTTLPFWRMPVALTVRTILGPYRSARARAELIRIRAAIRPQVWKARLREVLAVDYTPLLERIEVPTLYLRAKRDRVVFAAASRLIARHVPGAQVVEIDGPHFLLQAKPLEAAAAIAAFASEHGIRLGDHVLTSNGPSHQVPFHAHLIRHSA